MFVRFFVSMIASVLAARVPPLSPVRTRHRAWPWDCDANLHLNDGRYLSIAGLARVALMMRIGLFRLFARQGWRPVATGAEVRFFREIGPLARFTILTRIATWDAKYFYFEQIFERQGRDGPVACARVYVRSLFRRRDGVIPTAEVLEAAGHSGQAPEPDAELAHWIALSALVQRRP